MVDGVAEQVHAFADGYTFPLDNFQLRACEAIAEGKGVLVAAPTGSGKTVVAEFAVDLALSQGRKAFYTTPIKALSNQKYHDLVARYGAENIGLLTGDTSVNGEAPVVVMTTEVLRNMLYAGSRTLSGLGYVVMDEVHYLADRFRGPVWEEVIIHLPESVQLVSLSATVSNAEEFGEWLREVRGATEVIVHEHRPVPLWQHVLLGREIVDLFTEDSAGRPLDGLDGRALQLNSLVRHRMAAPRSDRSGRRGGPGHRRERRHSSDDARRRPPARPEVVRLLDRAGLLPAIVFIFSRAACDAAVEQCLASPLRLTSDAERSRIDAIVAERTASLNDADRAVLGYNTWHEGLRRGFAAHHAGLLPVFKEVVEELFIAGLVRVVYATETLALGVNMPARTVVLEKLVKWNGQTHADITPAEYTQLTGRAGRRGIDVEGHAVVLDQPGLDPNALAGLATTRTYPLRSSFRPTYNMAVNLVDQVGRTRARQILQSSFAQFQADASVVGLTRQLKRQEEALAGYRDAMVCDQGDFDEYLRLRRELASAEGAGSRARSAQRRSQTLAALGELRRGDVIALGTTRRPQYAVVVDEAKAVLDSERIRRTVVTQDHRLRQIGPDDVPRGVEVITTIKVPAKFAERSPQARRDVSSSLRNALSSGPPPRPARSAPTDPTHLDEAEIAGLRTALRRHPVHGCADRDHHLRWADRYATLERDTSALRSRVRGRTNTIARTFDRVCDLLVDRGYLSPDGEGGFVVTPQGRRLKRLYTESDLLVAECLRLGVWSELDPPALAACLSATLFESRREESDSRRIPGAKLRTALAETEGIWADLTDAEEQHKLAPTRPVDVGIAAAMSRWAAGYGLDRVLEYEESSIGPGDFVRWCRQVIDLAGQVGVVSADAGETTLRKNADAVVVAVRRGVVAGSL